MLINIPFMVWSLEWTDADVQHSADEWASNEMVVQTSTFMLQDDAIELLRTTKLGILANVIIPIGNSSDWKDIRPDDIPLKKT